MGKVKFNMTQGSDESSFSYGTTSMNLIQEGFIYQIDLIQLDMLIIRQELKTLMFLCRLIQVENHLM